MKSTFEKTLPVKPPVLIVDDNKDYREAAKETVELLNYAVLPARDANEAKEIVHDALIGPTICLVDYNMPDENGLSLIRYLTSTSRFDLACVLVTGNEDHKVLSRVWDCGGIGFFSKNPTLDGPEDNLGELYLKQIQFAERFLGILASKRNHDPLTGAYDRQEGMLRFTEEWNRARRHNSSTSFIVVDLDNLKHTNDEYGHLMGDEFIETVATVMKTIIRTLDTIVRYGGDEFLVILPETSEAEARGIAQRIASQVSEIKIGVTRGKAIPISISHGVGTLASHELTNDPIADFKKLFDIADKEQYLCKEEHRKRNRSS